jgi:hypothetical protein
MLRMNFPTLNISELETQGLKVWNSRLKKRFEDGLHKLGLANSRIKLLGCKVTRSRLTTVADEVTIPELLM